MAVAACWAAACTPGPLSGPHGAVPSGGAPIRLDGDAAGIDGATSALAGDGGSGDAIDRHLHLAIFRRALAEAGAA